MEQKTISKYIQLFEQEMDRRFMSKKTIPNYSCSAEKYLYYFHDREHPSHITDQDFKDYLYENFEDQSTQRSNHSGIKKFYEILFNKERFRYVKYANKKYTQIIILSEEEIQRLLQQFTSLKHFCITAIFYATGIRINELLNIKLTDIDRANEVIYVMGKGAKPRPVPMKKKLLEIIEAYYRKHKPKFWLFENDKTHKQYTEGSINGFLQYNAVKAGITKKVHAHLIRHCHASHSLYHGENLYTIQHILGHSSPVITANTYIHNSPQLIAKAFSPIDLLPLNTNRLLLA